MRFQQWTEQWLTRPLNMPLSKFFENYINRHITGIPNLEVHQKAWNTFFTASNGSSIAAVETDLRNVHLFHWFIKYVTTIMLCPKTELSIRLLEFTGSLNGMRDIEQSRCIFKKNPKLFASTMSSELKALPPMMKKNPVVQMTAVLVFNEMFSDKDKQVFDGDGFYMSPKECVCCIYIRLIPVVDSESIPYIHLERVNTVTPFGTASYMNKDLGISILIDAREKMDEYGIPYSSPSNTTVIHAQKFPKKGYQSYTVLCNNGICILQCIDRSNLVLTLSDDGLQKLLSSGEVYNH